MIDYHETLDSFLYDQNNVKGEDFIYIYNDDDFPEKLKPCFDNFKLILESKESKNSSSVATYALWLVKNYVSKI